MVFKVVPKPIASKEDSKVVAVKINSNSTVRITEVALRSVRGISRDLERMKDRWVSFPVGWELQAQFYSETLGQDYVELRQSLGQSSEIYNRLVLAASMSAMEDINLNSILADRRVSKLYELLSELDPEVASELAATGFDDEFESFQTVYSKTDNVPFVSHHATEANLFLCSEFCSNETFVEKVDAWRKWYDENSQNRGLQFTTAEPDFLFIANLHASRIAKSKGFSTADMNDWLVKNVVVPIARENIAKNVDKPGFPPQMLFTLKDQPLIASDATPNQQDVTK